MLTCDKCNGQITEDSGLCPHCGDPVTEADHPSAESVGKTVAVVELSFGRSSSPNYGQAMLICHNIPFYTESGEGKQLRHTVLLPITEIELILNLHRLVGGWKSSRMLINGQPAQRSDLVYRSVGCYRSRLKAADRDLYCFGKEADEANLWGCKRLGSPALAWGGGWLGHGHFDSEGVWHFDKDKIARELKAEIEENRVCPALDPQRVMDTLDRIPDTVDPNSDPNWACTTSYEETDDEDDEEVATGVRPVLTAAASYVAGDYQPEWNDATSYGETGDGDFEVLTGAQPDLKVFPSHDAGDHQPERESQEPESSSPAIGLQTPLPEESGKWRPFKPLFLVFAASLLVLLLLYSI